MNIGTMFNPEIMTLNQEQKQNDAYSKDDKIGPVTELVECLQVI